MGGVILVGAVIENDEVSYPGLARQSFGDVEQIYEHAAKHDCSPWPAVDVVPITRADGAKVVAVNVAPSVELIAARAANRDGAAIDGSWRFPVRRGTQADYLEPKELAMYMDPQVRRALVLLDRIPDAQRELVFVYHPQPDAMAGMPWEGTYRTARANAKLEGVAVHENTITLSYSHRSILRVPLRDVRDVWRHATHETWCIRLAGSVQMMPGKHPSQHPDFLDYVPLP